MYRTGHSVKHRSRVWLILGMLLIACRVQGAETGKNDHELKPSVVHAAMERGLVVLRSGVDNYPNNQHCFSCHHQTLPLLAFSSVFSKSGGMGLGYGGMGGAMASIPRLEPVRTKDIVQFTTESFKPIIPELRRGDEIDGKAQTVGYGLWTYSLAKEPRNEVTDALIENLVRTQRPEGHWDFHSPRPPASSSTHMATALALLGIQDYGNDVIDSDKRFEIEARATLWLVNATAPVSTEDIVGSLWCNYLLRYHLRAVVRIVNFRQRRGTSVSLREPTISVMDRKWAAREIDAGSRLRVAQQSNRFFGSQQLQVIQREDGGWGQELDMPSDAYATGQSLWMMGRVQETYKNPIEREPHIRKGIEFLIKNQQEDGSWHVVKRAIPVQPFFDNGDPHGADQFISIMATSWATAALANYLNANPETFDAPAEIQQPSSK